MDSETALVVVADSKDARTFETPMLVSALSTLSDFNSTLVQKTNSARKKVAQAKEEVRRAVQLQNDWKERAYNAENLFKELSSEVEQEREFMLEATTFLRGECTGSVDLTSIQGFVDNMTAYIVEQRQMSVLKSSGNVNGRSDANHVENAAPSVSEGLFQMTKLDLAREPNIQLSAEPNVSDELAELKMLFASLEKENTAVKIELIEIQKRQKQSEFDAKVEKELTAILEQRHFEEEHIVHNELDKAKEEIASLKSTLADLQKSSNQYRGERDAALALVAMRDDMLTDSLKERERLESVVEKLKETQTSIDTASSYMQKMSELERFELMQMLVDATKKNRTLGDEVQALQFQQAVAALSVVLPRAPSPPGQECRQQSLTGNPLLVNSFSQTTGDSSKVEYTDIKSMDASPQPRSIAPTPITASSASSASSADCQASKSTAFGSYDTQFDSTGRNPFENLSAAVWLEGDNLIHMSDSDPHMSGSDLQPLLAQELQMRSPELCGSPQLTDADADSNDADPNDVCEETRCEKSSATPLRTPHPPTPPPLDESNAAVTGILCLPHPLQQLITPEGGGSAVFAMGLPASPTANVSVSLFLSGAKTPSLIDSLSHRKRSHGLVPQDLARRVGDRITGGSLLCSNEEGGGKGKGNDSVGTEAKPQGDVDTRESYSHVNIYELLAIEASAESDDDDDGMRWTAVDPSPTSPMTTPRAAPRPPAAVPVAISAAATPAASDAVTVAGLVVATPGGSKAVVQIGRDEFDRANAELLSKVTLMRDELQQLRSLHAAELARAREMAVIESGAGSRHVIETEDTDRDNVTPASDKDTNGETIDQPSDIDTARENVTPAFHLNIDTDTQISTTKIDSTTTHTDAVGPAGPGKSHLPSPVNPVRSLSPSPASPSCASPRCRSPPCDSPADMNQSLVTIRHGDENDPNHVEAVDADADVDEFEAGQKLGEGGDEGNVIDDESGNCEAAEFLTDTFCPHLPPLSPSPLPSHSLSTAVVSPFQPRRSSCLVCSRIPQRDPRLLKQRTVGSGSGNDNENGNGNGLKTPSPTKKAIRPISGCRVDALVSPIPLHAVTDNVQSKDATSGYAAQSNDTTSGDAAAVAASTSGGGVTSNADTPSSASKRTGSSRKARSPSSASKREEALAQLRAIKTSRKNRAGAGGAATSKPPPNPPQPLSFYHPVHATAESGERTGSSTQSNSDGIAVNSRAKASNDASSRSAAVNQYGGASSDGGPNQQQAPHSSSLSTRAVETTHSIELCAQADASFFSSLLASPLSSSKTQEWGSRGVDSKTQEWGSRCDDSKTQEWGSRCDEVLGRSLAVTDIATLGEDYNFTNCIDNENMDSQTLNQQHVGAFNDCPPLALNPSKFMSPGTAIVSTPKVTLTRTDSNSQGYIDNSATPSCGFHPINMGVSACVTSVGTPPTSTTAQRKGGYYQLAAEQATGISNGQSQVRAQSQPPTRVICCCQLKRSQLQLQQATPGTNRGGSSAVNGWQRSSTAGMSSLSPRQHRQASSPVGGLLTPMSVSEGRETGYGATYPNDCTLLDASACVDDDIDAESQIVSEDAFQASFSVDDCGTGMVAAVGGSTEFRGWWSQAAFSCSFSRSSFVVATPTAAAADGSKMFSTCLNYANDSLGSLELDSQLYPGLLDTGSGSCVEKDISALDCSSTVLTSSSGSQRSIRSSIEVEQQHVIDALLLSEVKLHDTVRALQRELAQVESIRVQQCLQIPSTEDALTPLECSRQCGEDIVSRGSEATKPQQDLSGPSSDSVLCSSGTAAHLDIDEYDERHLSAMVHVDCLAPILAGLEREQATVIDSLLRSEQDHCSTIRSLQQHINETAARLDSLAKEGRHSKASEAAALQRTASLLEEAVARERQHDEAMQLKAMALVEAAQRKEEAAAALAEAIKMSDEAAKTIETQAEKVRAQHEQLRNHELKEQRLLAELCELRTRLWEQEDSFETALKAKDEEHDTKLRNSLNQLEQEFEVSLQNQKQLQAISNEYAQKIALMEELWRKKEPSSPELILELQLHSQSHSESQSESHSHSQSQSQSRSRDDEKSANCGVDIGGLIVSEHNVDERMGGSMVITDAIEPSGVQMAQVTNESSLVDINSGPRSDTERSWVAAEVARMWGSREEAIAPALQAVAVLQERVRSLEMQHEERLRGEQEQRHSDTIKLTLIELARADSDIGDSVCALTARLVDLEQRWQAAPPLISTTEAEREASQDIGQLVGHTTDVMRYECEDLGLQSHGEPDSTATASTEAGSVDNSDSDIIWAQLDNHQLLQAIQDDDPAPAPSHSHTSTITYDEEHTSRASPLNTAGEVSESTQPKSSSKGKKERAHKGMVQAVEYKLQQKQRNRVSGQLRELSRRYQQLMSDNDELRTAAGVVENRYAETIFDMSTRESQLERQVEALEAKLEAAAFYMQDAAEKGGRLAELEALVDRNAAVLVELSAGARSDRAQLDAATAAMSQKEKAYDELESTHRHLETVHRELLSLNEDLSRRNVALEGNYDELKLRYNSASEEVEKLNEAVHRLEDLTVKQEAELMHLNDRFESNLEAIRNKNAEHCRETDSLQASMHDLQMREAALSESAALNMGRLEAMQRSLDTERGAVARLQATLHNTIAALQDEQRRRLALEQSACARSPPSTITPIAQASPPCEVDGRKTQPRACDGNDTPASMTQCAANTEAEVESESARLEPRQSDDKTDEGMCLTPCTPCSSSSSMAAGDCETVPVQPNYEQLEELGEINNLLLLMSPVADPRAMAKLKGMAVRYESLLQVNAQLLKASELAERRYSQALTQANMGGFDYDTHSSCDELLPSSPHTAFPTLSATSSSSLTESTSVVDNSPSSSSLCYSVSDIGQSEDGNDHIATDQEGNDHIPSDEKEVLLQLRKHSKLNVQLLTASDHAQLLQQRVDELTHRLLESQEAYRHLRQTLYTERERHKQTPGTTGECLGESRSDRSSPMIPMESQQRRAFGASIIDRASNVGSKDQASLLKMKVKFGDDACSGLHFVGDMLGGNKENASLVPSEGDSNFTILQCRLSVADL